MNLNPVSSQSNYSKFIATVCNASAINYDACSCNIGNWSTQYNKLDCFNRFNCPYSLESDEFCNGNGYCDFSIGACICDQEYGSFDCSKQYIHFLPSPFLLVTMIIIASILLFLCISLMIWVHLYRDVGDVKAMSVVFTHLTLVGCASICCGTIVIGVGYDQANCVILEWFQFLGISMVIGCALLKAYRIASIFGASNFSPSDLTDNVLLKYFFIMVIVDIFFLGIYTAFNFVEGGAYNRYLSDELVKEVRCSSSPLTMVSYSLLVAWQLVLLLFVLKYGNQTRSASKIFKETKCIYVGSNIGSILFIAFGIFVLFTTNYTLQIIIRGYGSLIVVIMVIGLLFYPKFKAVYQLRLLKKKQSLNPNESFVDPMGNTLTEDQINLKRQYEANVKDPNGKELLLLLDALVRELSYRVDMKMLNIELKSIDLIKLKLLLDDTKDLIPIEIQQKYMKEKELMEQEKKQKQQQQQQETQENIIENNNDKKEDVVPIKSSALKPETNRNNSDSIASDSHNIQSADHNHNNKPNTVELAANN